jgi:phospholipase/carboxylesterase
MQRGLASVTPQIADWVKARLNELNLTENDLSLVGFSQGAMLSLYLTAAGLLSPKKIIAYSGLFVPPVPANSDDKNVDVIAFHGDNDQVLQIDMVKASYDLLPQHGIKNINFNQENGVDHYITERAIFGGARFLRE